MLVENNIEDRIRRLSEEERKLLMFKAEQRIAEKSEAVKSSDSNKLIAYITTKNTVDIVALKRSLRKKMPEYMVPSQMVEVDSFPRLPNGKIDKRSLQNGGYFSKEEKQDSKNIQLPTNEVENELLSIWKDILGIDEISTTDNFFEIGGDSILSIQVIAKARASGMPLTPKQLFEYQNISELARFVTSENERSEEVLANSSFKHLVAIRTKGNKPPVFCLHSGGTHFFFYNLFAKHLEENRPVYALQASPHEGNLVLHESVTQMAEDFISEIKEVHPNGPYHFISYCYNTAIGLEVVRLLENESESANLIIADTMADYLSLFATSRTPVRAAAFIDRLKSSPLKTVTSLVRGKLVAPLKEKLKNMGASGSKKKVQLLHHNHIKVYQSYNWQPVKSTINLLLTSKKNIEFNANVVNSWQNLSDSGVEVHQTQGHHNSLFLQSTVNETAKNVDSIMAKFEKKL
ncbi:thioesterase domain-containing protein [Flavobacteriaceae bacterium MAR_2009_75]|nr:thioesterase domain-containing protein [Flavobacteriaceae bacterium MAR_2009_75]